MIHGSGIDLNKFKPRRNKDKKIVFYRLLISKGIKDFIDSSKYVSDAKFVISGKFDFDNPDCMILHIFMKIKKV